MRIKFPKIRIIQQVLFALSCVGISCGCTYDDGVNGGPHSEMIRACTTKEDKIMLTDFVQVCIRDANPKSDEEPEDWIRQCQYSGERLICPQVPAVRSKPCEACRINHIPCSEIVDPELKKFCPKE